MSMIAERMKKDERKFELVEDQSELLRDLNTYLPKLMNYLMKKIFIFGHKDPLIKNFY